MMYARNKAQIMAPMYNPGRNNGVEAKLLG